jgi:hypothetical protein
MAPPVLTVNAARSHQCAPPLRRSIAASVLRLWIPAVLANERVSRGIPLLIRYIATMPIVIGLFAFLIRYIRGSL